jgi:hypothetical protein
MMKKKHKIVMLPTDDISGLVKVNGELRIEKGMRNYPKSIYKDAQQQHLYILSDDEIKEGDWIQVTSTVMSYEEAIKHWGEPLGKKIIATTDPKLQVDNVLNLTLEKFGKKHLPQIPQSLVENYVKHQPEYVELEYESYHGIETSIAEINAISGDGSKMWKGIGDNRDFRLKLINNEVVWLSITNEPDMYKYTRNDLEDLIFNAIQECKNMSNREIEEWFENNL